MTEITTGAGTGAALAPFVKVTVDVIRNTFHVDGRWVHLLTVGIAAVCAIAVARYQGTWDGIGEIVTAIVAAVGAVGVNEISPTVENVLPAKEG